MHAPPTKWGSRAGHAVHSVVAGPEQLVQVASHAKHEAGAVVLRYVAAGHAATHVDDERYGRWVGQEVQAALPAAVHVAHDASHGWHVLPLSAYSPAAHEETQAESDLYGVPEVGHERQSVASAPLHVAHEEWHAWHALSESA